MMMPGNEAAAVAVAAALPAQSNGSKGDARGAQAKPRGGKKQLMRWMCVSAVARSDDP
jgi:hypothetical protein